MPRQAVARAKTLRDIMNPKLLYVRDGDRMTAVRAQILRFGVTGVPVLDDAFQPVGFVSLRDLPTADLDRVRVSTPVAVALETDSIREGARKLAETAFHHLVVVDHKGVAVGMVSAVDFVRALLNQPVRHPSRFDAPPTDDPDAVEEA